MKTYRVLTFVFIHFYTINANYNFFPFGPSEGDAVLQRGDDEVSRPLKLRRPLQFYDMQFNIVYVATNGLLSSQPPPKEDQYLKSGFPLDFPAIAPFLVDVDTSVGNGAVYYRSDESLSALTRAAQTVQQGFPGTQFRPTHLVVTTWDHVACFKGDHESGYWVRAAAIAYSFIYIYLYTYSIYVYYFLSMTCRQGNSGVIGLWVFHVGSSRFPFQKVVGAVGPRAEGTEEPVTTAASQNFNIPEDLAVTASPVSGGVQASLSPENISLCGSILPECSPDGYCTEYTGGPCCRCRSGYYGNGRQCLPMGVSQRLNGQLSGRVSVGATDVQLDRVDVHGYAVPGEGRVYVSISPIPPQAGWALMVVGPLLSTFGWLFALELHGHQNGFSVTGAEFSHQAEMTFYPGNQHLNITQQAQGLDSLNHLKMEMNIKGNLPSIPSGAKVQFQPYTETLHYNQSVLTSSSLHQYIVVSENGGSEMFSYLLHQNISFPMCEHSPLTIPEFQQLDVAHVMVMYTSEGRILKYAIINTVGPVGGELPGLVELNPCRSGKHFCDPMALCLPGEGLQYHCQCAMGFRGDGRNCYDVDECSEGLSSCGPHSECVNMPGSHHCLCETGYEFDFDWRACVGECVALVKIYNFIVVCRRYLYNSDILCCYDADIDECLLKLCHPMASCSNTLGSFHCRCWPSYEGDGFLCQPQKQTGSIESVCERHRNGLLEGLRGWGGDAMLQDYVPQCDEKGQYRPLQCLGSTGHCWCVDSRGQERVGTRTLPGTPHTNCDQPGTATPPHLYQNVPKLTSSPSGPALLSAHGSEIRVIPLNDSQPVLEKCVYLFLQDSVVVGISYDCQENTLYWSNVARSSISRASLEFGAEPVTIIHTDVVYPEGVAVDTVHRQLFWVDSGSDRIEAASLDGQNRRVLFDTNLVNPRAIAVDTTSRTLFWTDWDRDAPRIERSSVEGLHRTVLVGDGLRLPNALTIDPVSAHLCWADAGTKKLECISADGTDRQEINSGLDYPFSLTIYNNHVYYTDWERCVITITPENCFSLPQKSHLYGIAFIPPQCP
uniref:Nidogen 2b (osteonidogen) n=1 Tax=Pygocentrus nattereri TaxID=42514 RepID=A0A3B4EK71_PYGNA